MSESYLLLNSLPEEAYSRDRQSPSEYLSVFMHMLGGWDGFREPSDFWMYNIVNNKWTMLCEETVVEGGQVLRSYNKMVLDPQYRQIFNLDKYLERSLGHGGKHKARLLRVQHSGKQVDHDHR